MWNGLRAIKVEIAIYYRGDAMDAPVEGWFVGCSQRTTMRSHVARIICQNLTLWSL